MNVVDFLIPIFGTVSLLGMYAASRYGRKTKKFKWSEYWLLLAAPLLCCASLLYWFGIKILYLFLVSMIIGIFLEYILGYGYHMTLNKRLWTYSRYSLNGYTSWLVLPMWGIAGVAFWLIIRMIGL
jgi:uncharacterized membrane protein